jgi:hypothetical protein
VGQRIRFGTMEEYLSFPRVTSEGQEYLVISWKDVCFIEVDDAQVH